MMKPTDRMMLAVTLVTGQPIGLAKRDEKLMPIEFPSHFLIACNFRIEKVDLTPMNQRRPLTGDRFQAPVNRISETEIGKSRADQNVRNRCGRRGR